MKLEKKFIYYLAFFAFFALGIYFVTADYTLSISNETSAFNFNEDEVRTYNVTIHNTDVNISGNASVVNITLPNGFTFYALSNSYGQAIFTNTSSVLSWRNDSGLILNATNISFWFNLSAQDPGNYTLIVRVVNASGQTEMNLSITINDTLFASATNVTNYNYTDSNQGVYNITVRNTDTSSNITELNITFPSNFTFHSGTNGNGGFSAIFTNTSSVLSWRNDSGLILNATNISFWFSLTAGTNKNGSYNMSIKMSNAFGSNISNINVTILDRTRPGFADGPDEEKDTESFTVTWTPNEAANYSFYYGETSDDIDIEVDDDNSFTNSERSESVNNLDEDTVYYYNITMCDRNRNCFSDDGNVRTDQDSGGGGGGGSNDDTTTGFWSETFYENDELKTIKEINISLANKERVRIKVDGDRYYVGVVKLSSSSVTLNITDGDDLKLQTKFDEGDSNKYEIDGDNYYDLYVKLTDIKNSEGNITIRYLHELKSGSNNNGGPVFSNQSNNVNSTTNSSLGNNGSLGGIFDDIAENVGSPWKLFSFILLAIIILVLIGIIIAKATKLMKRKKVGEDEKMVNKVKQEINSKTAKHFMKSKVNVKSP